MMTKNVELASCDLIVDRVYRGGRAGNAADDPLPKLVGVSNQGGFRYLGNKDNLKMVVLITSLSDPNWPDEFDPETGIFTYYGDNKVPGRDLHDTPRFGNQILRSLFAGVDEESGSSSSFPPVLLFSKTGSYRDMKFLGLAVPGVKNQSFNEDLVAIWKIYKGERFQNYRAKLTVLNVPSISRLWLGNIQSGNALESPHCPSEWRDWLIRGEYQPLTATPSIEHRSKQEQLPEDRDGWRILKSVYGAFADDPIAFERCAADIVRFVMPNVASMDLTRPSRDGGRDAVGDYRIGVGRASILVDFAVEAKCYNPEKSSVGVRETSRLISRLRHRQFGVMVTTSYLNSQAYKEIKEDGHPIIIISGKDIVEILKKEFPDFTRLSEWLDTFKSQQ